MDPFFGITCLVAFPYIHYTPMLAAKLISQNTWEIIWVWSQKQAAQNWMLNTKNRTKNSATLDLKFWPISISPCYPPAIRWKWHLWNPLCFSLAPAAEITWCAKLCPWQYHWNKTAKYGNEYGQRDFKHCWFPFVKMLALFGLMMLRLTGKWPSLMVTLHVFFSCLSHRSQFDPIQGTNWSIKLPLVI